MTSVRRVAVAFSGGRDSTALLHATVRSAQALQSEGLLLEVVALHIHHGLNPQADAWLAHGQQFCQTLQDAGLPVCFRAFRLVGAPATGESIEAWARTGRHAALSALAREEGADLLLLAHHRRDQAETFVLQALRGAGLAGLAAMPRQQQRDGVNWARPWLACSRDQVQAYVDAFNLPFVDDGSNEEVRFARNRLRLGAWPALARDFPSAEASLAQSAAWVQEALALQDEMARVDLDGLRVVETKGAACAALDWLGLRRLSPARQSNALRAWLRECRGQAAPASLVRRLLTEGDGCGRWVWGAWQLQAYRGRLSCSLIGPEQGDAHAMRDPACAVAADALLDLSSEGQWTVEGWQGQLRMQVVTRGGIALHWLGAVSLSPRPGGVQFQSHAQGVPRSLKKSYQAAAVPAWARRGPLLFAGSTLLYVPGLGVDARVQAPAGVPQLLPEWLPGWRPDAAC